MRLPNFFIVGAPKAGTSALSEYLGQHPNIFMAKPKESHFFADDLPGMRTAHSLEQYLALFEPASDTHIAVGEASVWYLFSSTALHNIRKFNPAARIILMLRNPIELVYSLHSQSLMSTDEDLPDFRAAWRLQDERAAGRHIPETCREPALLQYRYTGLLGKQLQNALKIFPKEQLHICLFDDFKRDTKSSYETTCDFLGVSKTPQPEFTIVNANKYYRSRRIAELVERPPEIFSRKIVGFKLSHIRKLMRRINSKTAPRQIMDNALRKQLSDYFRTDIHLLETLIERDLSHWLVSVDSNDSRGSQQDTGAA